MKLFTPFTIPKKDNCDLCKIKTNKKNAVENPFIDDFFRNLNRQRFDFVFDWPRSIKMKTGQVQINIDFYGKTVMEVLLCV